MSEGVVLDRTDQSLAAVPSWVEGQPERSVWTGLKLGGKPRYDIAAWRCTRCGFLEHYASAEPSGFDRSRKQFQLVVVVAAVLVALAAGLAAALLAR